MKLSYFADTDTLYIELKSSISIESMDMDENTIIVLDVEATVVAITIEHASSRVDLKTLIVSGIAAWN